MRQGVNLRIGDGEVGQAPHSNVYGDAASSGDCEDRWAMRQRTVNYPSCGVVPFRDLRVQKDPTNRH
jgi:hypothetical protein